MLSKHDSLIERHFNQHQVRQPQRPEFVGSFRSLNPIFLHPIVEIGLRGLVAVSDELLGGTVGQ